MLGLILAMFACQPDEFNLGGVLSKSDLQYSITQDATDPNMVILESLTPGVTPLWVTPMGRSTRVKDTLRFPFAGEYQFVYGVESAGGLVQADTYQLNITTDNFDYVTDPLWTMLTGGVGESKTWVLDLFPKDEAPSYAKYFVGPLYFYGTDDSWATVTEGQTVEGDSWNWKADWAGNGSWLFGSETQLDYGTMTFDLIGGAHMTVDHKILGRQESGSFMLDASNHTMRTTDAYILHDAGRDGVVIDWGDLKVLSLTENTMQLAALRDAALSGEGACLLVYNFIAKDYSDSWVAPDQPDPEPPYDGDANEDLTTAVSTTKTWKIDMDIPYNWHGLDGSALNEVASTASDGGFAFSTWTPPYDEAAFGAVSMTLTKEGDDGGTYSIQTLDGSYEGSYTVDESNNIDFGQPVTFFSNVGGWLTFGTTAENTLRIIISEKDAIGNIEGIWLGQRSTDKAEYLSLHLSPVAGSGADDVVTATKKIITAKTWKLDSDRTYDKTTSWGAEQGPVIFSDYATWAWNPLPGQQYAAGEEGVDYGTVKFEMDGTVTVQQRKRIYTLDADGSVINGIPNPDDGAFTLQSDEVVTLNGTWAIDLDANTITMSVGMLHPWTCDYAVADWGALKIYRIESNALLLQETRDPDLSGEGEFDMTYIFVPAE